MKEYLKIRDGLYVDLEDFFNEIIKPRIANIRTYDTAEEPVEEETEELVEEQEDD